MYSILIFPMICAAIAAYFFVKSSDKRVIGKVFSFIGIVIALGCYFSYPFLQGTFIRNSLFGFFLMLFINVGMLFLSLNKMTKVAETSSTEDIRESASNRFLYYTLLLVYVIYYLPLSILAYFRHWEISISTLYVVLCAVVILLYWFVIKIINHQVHKVLVFLVKAFSFSLVGYLIFLVIKSDIPPYILREEKNETGDLVAITANEEYSLNLIGSISEMNDNEVYDFYVRDNVLYYVAKNHTNNPVLMIYDLNDKQHIYEEVLSGQLQSVNKRYNYVGEDLLFEVNNRIYLHIKSGIYLIGNDGLTMIINESIDNCYHFEKNEEHLIYIRKEDSGRSIFTFDGTELNMYDDLERFGENFYAYVQNNHLIINDKDNHKLVVYDSDLVYSSPSENTRTHPIYVNEDTMMVESWQLNGRLAREYTYVTNTGSSNKIVFYDEDIYDNTNIYYDGLYFSTSRNSNNAIFTKNLTPVGQISRHSFGECDNGCTWRNNLRVIDDTLYSLSYDRNGYENRLELNIIKTQEYKYDSTLFDSIDGLFTLTVIMFTLVLINVSPKANHTIDEADHAVDRTINNEENTSEI